MERSVLISFVGLVGIGAFVGLGDSQGRALVGSTAGHPASSSKGVLSAKQVSCSSQAALSTLSKAGRATLLAGDINGVPLRVMVEAGTGAQGVRLIDKFKDALTHLDAHELGVLQSLADRETILVLPTSRDRSVRWTGSSLKVDMFDEPDVVGRHLAVTLRRLRPQYVKKGSKNRARFNLWAPAILAGPTMATAAVFGWKGFAVQALASIPVLGSVVGSWFAELVGYPSKKSVRRAAKSWLAKPEVLGVLRKHNAELMDFDARVLKEPDSAAMTGFNRYGHEEMRLVAPGWTKDAGTLRFPSANQLDEYLASIPSPN